MGPESVISGTLKNPKPEKINLLTKLNLKYLHPINILVPT